MTNTSCKRNLHLSAAGVMTELMIALEGSCSRESCESFLKTEVVRMTKVKTRVKRKSFFFKIYYLIYFIKKQLVTHHIMCSSRLFLWQKKPILLPESLDFFPPPAVLSSHQPKTQTRWLRSMKVTHRLKPIIIPENAFYFIYVLSLSF